MIKSQESTSSTGEVQNQRQEHLIHVMLAMSDFLVLRSGLSSSFKFLNLFSYIVLISMCLLVVSC